MIPISKSYLLLLLVVFVLLLLVVSGRFQSNFDSCMASQSANLWVLLGLGLAGIVLLTRKLKQTIKEDLGAFIHKLQLLPPPPPPPPKAPHPLTTLTFTLSDLYVYTLLPLSLSSLFFSFIIILSFISGVLDI